jgi:hypothetical protein
MGWQKARLLFCKLFVFVALWTLVFTIVEKYFGATHYYIYAMVGYFLYPLLDEIDSWIQNPRDITEDF